MNRRPAPSDDARRDTEELRYERLDAQISMQYKTTCWMDIIYRSSTLLATDRGSLFFLLVQSGYLGAVLRLSSPPFQSLHCVDMSLHVSLSCLTLSLAFGKLGRIGSCFSYFTGVKKVMQLTLAPISARIILVAEGRRIQNIIIIFLSWCKSNNFADTSVLLLPLLNSRVVAEITAVRLCDMMLWQKGRRVGNERYN